MIVIRRATAAQLNRPRGGGDDDRLPETVLGQRRLGRQRRRCAAATAARQPNSRAPSHLAPSHLALLLHVVPGIPRCRLLIRLFMQRRSRRGWARLPSCCALRKPGHRRNIRLRQSRSGQPSGGTHEACASQERGDVSLSGLAASRRIRPGVDHRGRERHVRRGAAGRDRRSGEPRAHREGPHGRHRRLGQYRITELRPGAYTVTFTLPGFNTVKRDGINLTGAFTATVDAEMRVGALEETITVTGEAPIVDVQSTTRQRVDGRRKPSARCRPDATCSSWACSFPASRSRPAALASQDVGGALGPETRALVAHGGRTEDQRFMMNGVSLSSMIGGGWGGGAIPNATGVQEMVFDTASVSARTCATGGVRINFIAREGGNQYHGTIFGNFANDAFQTTNVSAELLARNPALANAGSVDKNWDFNPGFRRTASSATSSGSSPAAASRARICSRRGMFYNKNANDPTKWTYEPDLSRPASLEKTWLDAQLRIVVAGQPEEQDRRHLYAAGLLRLSRRHHRHRRRPKRATTAGSRRSASSCSTGPRRSRTRSSSRRAASTASSAGATCTCRPRASTSTRA